MAHRAYSEQFKIDAVKKVKRAGSVNTVADTLGVQPNSLRNWMKVYGAEDDTQVLNAGEHPHLNS